MSVFRNGYCYLQWVADVNNASVNPRMRVAVVKRKFGYNPLVREVLGYIYMHLDSDVWITAPRYVSPGLLHVAFGDVVRFSELLDMFMFSESRVGADGKESLYIDSAMAKKRELAQLFAMMESAGLDTKLALSEASSNMLRVYVRDNERAVREALTPIVNKSSNKLVISYKMTKNLN